VLEKPQGLRCDGRLAGGIQRLVERIQRWLDRHTPSTGPCGAHGASGNDGQKGHLTPLVSISELSSASGVCGPAGCEVMRPKPLCEVMKPRPRASVLNLKSESAGAEGRGWDWRSSKGSREESGDGQTGSAEHGPIWSSPCFWKYVRSGVACLPKLSFARLL